MCPLLTLLSIRSHLYRRTFWCIVSMIHRHHHHRHHLHHVSNKIGLLLFKQTIVQAVLFCSLVEFDGNTISDWLAEHEWHWPSLNGSSQIDGYYCCCSNHMIIIIIQANEFLGWKNVGTNMVLLLVHGTIVRQSIPVKGIHLFLLLHHLVLEHIFSLCLNTFLFLYYYSYMYYLLAS